MRELLRQRIARGHVTVAARVEQRPGGAIGVDEAKFAQFAAILLALRERHGLGGVVDVAAVLRMPEVVRSSGVEDNQGTAAELVTIVAMAADALTRMREAEGERLADMLRDRISAVEAAVGRITERAPQRVIAQRNRLRENVKVLAEGFAVDELRLAQEVAILADRLDVGEELDRFGAHIAAFREALGAVNGEPVGKRLGFLLQEMLREANTTGSKANDAAMQGDVVQIKEELERIREQVENLE